jgi:hypothetical protein
LTCSETVPANHTLNEYFTSVPVYSQVIPVGGLSQATLLWAQLPVNADIFAKIFPVLVFETVADNSIRIPDFV